jgi:Xaa-Pro dipeptidase
LFGSKRVAMQYSHNCAIPSVSLVDAGTADLIRSFGVDIVSSANLVQEFESKLTEEQIRTHLEAGRNVDRVRSEAFDFIGQRLRANEPVTEFEVQQFILQRFSQRGLIADHGPIVARNQNASNPHFEPSQQFSSTIELGDLVLIDLWAKLDVPNAVYYDVTWTGVCGERIPERVQEIFETVCQARSKACAFVAERAARRENIAGFEVDDVARAAIEANGLGEFFFHRTGHNIGTEVHGAGANLDNLESHDVRILLPRTLFSVEPGIYLPEFGIRSEVNVLMLDGEAHITGEEQEHLVRI